MKKLRLAALCLALAMLLCTLPVSAAGNGWLVPKTRTYDGRFTDVKGTWCESYVETVYEAGLMEGKSADRFDPNGTLTEAQRLVIGARLHALLHGGTVEQAAPGEDWWLPAARYYLAVDGSTTNAPSDFAPYAGDPANRLSFALQMVWSTPAEALPAVNAVKEVPDFTEDRWTDDNLRQDVLTLYRAGILNGVDQWGRFNPQGKLTRGQAAAMLARVIDPSLRLKFELPEFSLCRDVLGVEPDTVLLKLNGEKIPADIFAYACVASGTLNQVKNQEPWMLSSSGAEYLLRQYAAYDLLAETLLAEGHATAAVSPEQQQEIRVRADRIAGTAGISREGWEWIFLHETQMFQVTMYYMVTYGESSGFHNELSGVSMLSSAVSDAEKQVRMEPTPALKAIDWNAAYTRALKTPCAGDYQLLVCLYA